MRQTEEEIDDVWCGPIVREGPNRYGSVPELEDEELADPLMLEQLAFIVDWAPILALPDRGRHSRFRPITDEFGQPEWGAFGTVDFERMYGSFDKARYKADKLEEDLRYSLIRMETPLERIKSRSKYLVLKYLSMGVIDFEDIEDMDMQWAARWYLRAKRLRQEIRRLREYSQRRRMVGG